MLIEVALRARVWSATLLVFLAATPAAACSSSESPDVPSDLAMHRVGPEHTGVYETAGVLETPQVKWVFQTNAGIFSSSAVIDGKVLFGSNDGNLYALNSETGTTVWKFQTGRPVRTSPLVADGVVYFGSDDGFISAINLDDGEVAWRARVKGMVRSSPVFSSGTLFFGSDSGSLHAYDATTGLLKWETPLTSTRHIVRSSPAVVGDTIFVANAQVQPFRDAVSNDLTAQFQSTLFALERSSGEIVWSYPLEGYTGLPVATGGGAVFVATTKATDEATTRWFDGRLYAIEQSSGELRWVFHDERVGAWTSPAVTDDRLLWQNTEGRLYSLDIVTGDVEWTFESDSQAFSLPSVADGLVYFGDNEGKVTAVDIATGLKRWEFQTAVEAAFCPRGFCGFERNTPVISNGVLYVGNRAGYFYALETGSEDEG